MKSLSKPKLDKTKLVAKIIQHIEEDLNVLIRSALAAREAATHEESKSEDKHDTRGLEASYLAGAQAKRAAEMQELLLLYSKMPVQNFINLDSVQPMALVNLEYDEKFQWIFIVPKAGGSAVQMGDVLVQLVTPISPLGEELMGRKAGDEFELKVSGKIKEYKILDVT